MRNRLLLLLLGVLVVFGCGGGDTYIPAIATGGGGGSSSFALTGGGTQTVTAGQTATFTINVVEVQGSQPGRAANPVTLSIDTPPSDLTASLSATNVTPTLAGVPVTLTVNTFGEGGKPYGALTGPGSYTLTVRGTDGTTNRSINCTVIVGLPLNVMVSPTDSNMTDENGYPGPDDTFADYAVSVMCPTGYTGKVRLSYVFVEANAPPTSQVTGTWHYGINQYAGTFEYDVTAANLTDTMQLTLNRVANITTAGNFTIRITATPLAPGFLPATTDANLNVRDDGPFMRPNGG